MITALMVPMIASAQTGIPASGTFTSQFRVQNLGSAAATCAYDVFNDNGTSAASSITLGSIASGASAYVAVDSSNANFPAGTTSVVLSCSEEVAATVLIRDGAKSDAYTGISAPASELYIPSAYKNYFNYQTTTRIQNTGSTAQNVQVVYYLGSTAVHTQTVPLAGNGSATVDQSPITQLANNQSYSMKLTAQGSDPIAAVQSIFGRPTSTVAKQLYSFGAFSGGSTGTIYAPVIMRNYFGYNTATTIQNLGNALAEVDVIYSNGQVRNFNIPAKGAVVVSDFAEPTLAKNVLYSSRIQAEASTTAQPLIVTVNESTPTTNRATTYEALASGAAKQASPYVVKRYPYVAASQATSYNTSITCQNVGSTNITAISANFKGESTIPPAGPTAVDVTVPLTGLNIAPGQTYLVYPPSYATVPNGFFGSAVMTATGGTMGCVVNVDRNMAPATETNDWLSAYDTIVMP